MLEITIKRFLLAVLLNTVVILLIFPLIKTNPFLGAVTIIEYLLHPQRSFGFDWRGFFFIFGILIFPMFIDVCFLTLVVKRPEGKITAKVIIKKILLAGLIFFIPFAALYTVGLALSAI